MHSVLVRLNFLTLPGFCMVGLLVSLPCIRVVRLSEAPDARMVGILEAPRVSYSWFLRRPLVFVWLDS